MGRSRGRVLALAPALACAAGPAVGDPGSVDGSGSSSDGAPPDLTGSEDATGGDGDGDGDGEVFSLDVHTFLTDEGVLALETNLPWAVDACLALPVLDVPCEDEDLDALVDAWEAAAIDRLRPRRRMDEDEQLIGDPTATIGDVGRAAPGPDAHLRLFVMLGYSLDYGSCGGFTGHHGDSERVALDLRAEPAGGPGGVRVEAAYTAAHEGSANDQGRVFTGPDLGQLVIEDDPELGEPRWIVFPSADKHATYATIEICEGVSAIPCFDEDCGPDGVSDPDAFDRLPAFVNAGEEQHPLVDDLAGVGFPGESAWADQDFCGGLGGTTCSSSVRSKLLSDPF
jgi:hypothetical protein